MERPERAKRASAFFGVDTVIVVTQVSGAELTASSDVEEHLFGLKVVGENYATDQEVTTLLVLYPHELAQITVRLVEILAQRGHGEDLKAMFDEEIAARLRKRAN